MQGHSDVIEALNEVLTLEQGLARFDAGSFGCRRGLFADSLHLPGGDVLAAAELCRYVSDTPRKMGIR